MTETLGISTLSDDDLAAVLDMARSEWQRRRDLTNALGSTPGLTEALQDSTGREMGAPYVPPTGYHDAYPRDWQVTHDDALWTATRDGATGIPGESPDWVREPIGDEILPWEQRHAGSEYGLGEKVTHDGHYWKNTIDRNGWEPGTPHSGWEDLGPVETP